MAYAVLGSNLYPSIHDPVDGTLLAGGLIYFYASDQITPKSVYMDPQRNDVYPNPLTLDSVGQQPPIYYDTDEEYWIEIFRAPEPGCPCVTDSPIYSFFFYPDTTDSESSDYADNFISNGQFSHPISFNDPDDASNKLITSHTFVAQGWEFNVDNPEENIIYVNFVELFDSTSVEGNPSNYINVNVQSFTSVMTQLDLFQTIGYVNTLQGQDVTFSLYGYSTSGTEQIEILIENIYDDDTTILTPVETITLTTEPSSLSVQFSFPEVESNNIDSVNNKTNIIIRFPLSQIVDIFITNVQLEKGSIDNPVFVEKPRDETSSRTFFNHFVFPDDDTDYLGVSAYRRLTYINNQFSWYTHTGTFKIVDVNNVPADMELCIGQTVDATDYSDSGIPYGRLYSVIGNTFGGNQSLIAVSSDNVVTIGPPIGGKELTPYTSGTLGSLVTILRTEEGLKLWTLAEKISSTKVRLTNRDLSSLNISPGNSSLCDPAAHGYWHPSYGSPVLVTVVNDYTTDLEFSVINPSVYRSYGDVYLHESGVDYYTGVLFFEFSSTAPYDPVRANYSHHTTPVPPSPTSYNAIRIKVDGSLGRNANMCVGVVTVDVDFSSSIPMSQNIDRFIRAVNNPFQYTVTINSTLTGSEGDYFLYSSISTGYYGWIRVDGSGTDPAIVGRTGTVIDILSTDDIDVQASKVAESISSSTFTFPDAADFPTVPNVNLGYAVYL